MDAALRIDAAEQDTPASRERIGTVLRAHGILPTHQRVEIAHVLFAQRQHLSADRLLALVNARHAETSKATVYNTLRLFVAHGLVRELVVDPAKVFYDSNMQPHHHFYNVASGELTDFRSEGVTLAGLPPLPEGTVADGVEVIVRTRPA